MSVAYPMPMQEAPGQESESRDPLPQIRTMSQTSVLTRLQALFPSSPQPASRESIASDPVIDQNNSVPVANSVQKHDASRFLKMRIVTWNMHDSLPKGNFEDLLGTVPPYVPLPEGENDRTKIPNLNMEDCHPYHLVVVAGQECPTVSGIPMGLAATFKHKERETHKDEDKLDESRDAEAQTVPSLSNDSASTSGPAHVHSAGWSWVLEEWFCHGLGQAGNQGTQSVNDLYNTEEIDAAIPGTLHDRSTGPLESHPEAPGDQKKHKARKQKDRKGNRTGPYELLVKERLMGIYIAVFIYRDLKPLVQGCSKSAVTAGLIGGRVGNKGGVGISVNIGGTSLLFLNAHLAAHEGRVMSRVANMNKIKSELQVRDFLSQDDPRVMSEDLTDKFDYTFIFGDLNFRLDVTRIHADWLIARKEYDQALAFDQLQRLIKNGKAFVGFNEGHINFPPTFKYDVMRSLKRDKSHLSRELLKRREGKKRHSQLSNFTLSEVQEVDADTAEIRDDDANSADELIEPSRAASIDTDDNRSLISTIVTASSAQSRATLAGYEDVPVSSDLPRTSPSSDTKTSALAAHKGVLTKAALKAKDKWFAIITHKEPRPPISRGVSRKRRRDFALSAPNVSSSQTEHNQATKSHNDVDLISSSTVELSLPQPTATLNDLRPISSKKSAVSASTNNASLTGKTSDTNEAESSCYDSSSKQRVPSWCDRILWKSTVPLEPDSEDEEEETINVDHRSGLGPRMLQFLAHALKPLSTRTRALSLSSIDVPDPVDSISVRQSKLPPRALTISPDFHPVATTAEEKTALPKVKISPSIPNLRLRFHPKAQTPRLNKSKSIEPPMTTPLLGPNFRRRGRTQSVAPRISAPIVDLPSPHPPEPEHAVSVGDDALDSLLEEGEIRQNISSAKSWRFFPFLGREGEGVAVAQASKVTVESPTKTIAPKPTVRRPRKGEVVVLGYRSLDDQAMRRLEGRSDHRPVIGSYAIII